MLRPGMMERGEEEKEKRTQLENKQTAREERER
jgi:hypothetical protein